MGWYIGSKLRDKAGSWGGGVVVGLFYREQKHICGKDYDTAQYMEVDLYQVSAKKHKASRRAKKKEASSLAQQTYNDKRAKRYHVQLVNTNFGKGDFSWTGTYDDDHLPARGTTGGRTWTSPTSSNGCTAGATATECSGPSGWPQRNTPPWARMGPSAAGTTTTPSSSTRRG